MPRNPQKSPLSPAQMLILNRMMEGYTPNVLLERGWTFWRGPKPPYGRVSDISLRWLIDHKLIVGYKNIYGANELTELTFKLAFPNLKEITDFIETENEFTRPICKVVDSYLMMDMAQGKADADGIDIGIVVKRIRGMTSEELNQAFGEYVEASKKVPYWHRSKRVMYCYFFYPNDPLLDTIPKFKLKKPKE